MEQNNYRSSSRTWAGLLLIAAGLLLFAYKLGAPVPGWLFTWPVAFIVSGLVIGAKHRFRNNIWIIFVAIGSLNLVNQFRPDLNFNAYVAPVIIILVGLIFILRPSRNWRRHWTELRQGHEEKWQQHLSDDIENNEGDYIDSVSVFGGVKK